MFFIFMGLQNASKNFSWFSKFGTLEIFLKDFVGTLIIFNMNLFDKAGLTMAASSWLIVDLQVNIL